MVIICDGVYPDLLPGMEKGLEKFYINHNHHQA